MADIVDTRTDAETALARAVETLGRGVPVAIPTETVYGFGGGIDRDSVDALVALKHRPPGKPFLLLVAGADMIERLDLRMPAYAANLAARHWPGPLTLVLSGGERRVPDRLRGPEGGVAVRWTSDERIGWARGIMRDSMGAETRSSADVGLIDWCRLVDAAS